MTMLIMLIIWSLMNVFLSGAQGQQSNDKYRKFPDGFQFGGATASYQVEGGWNISDKGENIWDRYCHTTKHINNRSTGDVACDSYHQYARDVEMLKELGVNFYRFSLSWSRILPTGFSNKISTDGIAYYNRLIDLLVENNISPVVTLYHWDLPQSLQDLGGWPNPWMVKYFTDYARVAFSAFGDRVTDWLTFNEPIDVCDGGYGSNEKAPGIQSPGIGEYLCGHTILKAHARVYHLYNDTYKSTQKGRVGFTMDVNWHEPENPNSTADLEASERALQFIAGWFGHPIYSKEGDYPAVFKDRIASNSIVQGFSSSRLPVFTPDEVLYIKGTYDFLGLNHYTSLITRSNKDDRPSPSPSFSNDLGVIEYQRKEWPTAPGTSWLKVVPWGLRKALLWLKVEYNNPEIVIFENGYSDLGGTNDTGRIDYYKRYLNAMLDAMEEGVNVSGYTAWSLMDNFEWLQGYSAKFGLYQVDFESVSRTRTAKASVKFYSNITRTRQIERVFEKPAHYEMVPTGYNVIMT
nr:myrosinase 1-like protein [Limnephilus flavicornis]